MVIYVYMYVNFTISGTLKSYNFIIKIKEIAIKRFYVHKLMCFYSVMQNVS